MDILLQSNRKQLAWAIVRRLRRTPTQCRSKSPAPAFLTDGVGEATAARVTEQVRAIVHRHRQGFPKARLREVLPASGDARRDPELAAWGNSFGAELRAALNQAARGGRVNRCSPKLRPANFPRLSR